MSDRLSQRALAVPHAARLSFDDPYYAAIIVAHDTALAAGDDGYNDPATGLYVFTAEFLARSDMCCEAHCRHCPYID